MTLETGERPARVGKRAGGKTVWPTLDGNGQPYTRPVAATVGLDDKGHFFVVSEGQRVSRVAIQEMRDSLKTVPKKTRKPTIRSFDEGADKGE